ncbi:ADP-ribose pyrophosphatase YjhB (NUDIX family) [Clostridium tetanomorphum]|uniref:NUDIX domain-containing protein n=1 Tax=Clostridium tetanomorphum TaxID=1553 RepID=A0A923E7Q7_CLOTT|nr:NUDIX domain-containing protein [Clostridium tetanomorphum]KAJ50197.1 NUDIX hydrolase [Clostridium tetanomorphum DSM 665]MBC2396241.1 NUDIX domain-containing protein [Clostridium tetanomorphum]MBP1864335.1 ADP-ribose pyrophosphatase YjhB (NUDIX family) [Clostridium tetanomorphum]NRS83781.1 ADP-ribose pyrophosphatase YjhB (NUDIX family) [Clostridium tetanomorphum]NRZ96972.1 ADP-ribose pyrophosphatase YjhB (NUDIX family) [Clostridium tetanomorphum]
MDKHFIDKEEEFLKNYDENNYKRPSVTNDIIIFTTDDIKEDNLRKVPKKGLQVILIKRDDYPYIGKWALPGGFIGIEEDLEASAMRKLKEKTGIDNVYTEQLYTFGDAYRDKRTRVISVGNIALVEKSSIRFKEVDFQKKSEWFWIDKTLVSSEKQEQYTENKHLLSLKSIDEKIIMNYEVTEKIGRDIFRRKETSYRLLNNSTEELAFDHYKILDYGIDRLRNKVEYTPIAFNLLPRVFTVKELQNVYEAIMGREILNFRRKMGEMIIETDEKIEGKPFRPAKVFKFNEDWEHNF